MTTAGGIPGLAPGGSGPIRSRGSTASRAPLSLMLGVLLGAATPAFAQVPSPAQAQSALQQAVQQNPGLPDQIRQRLQQSGLTAEQVRARLSASGYAPNLLDAYLGSAAPGQGAPAPGALELSAIQALGLPVEQSYLPVDSGFIRTRGAGPASNVFGVDVFRRSTTQFLPLLSGPVPPDYKLGAGDQLVLILTGDVELAYTLPVTREGFILIPQVGQVFVSNLTLDQLRAVLFARLGRVYSGVRRGANASTRFDISVANVRANQVYVVGEVTQPGAYQISSLGTALTALYAAGGVTERANMRDVVVERAGKTVATLDLYDYLLRGETRNDIRLETGDVIFVPVHGTRVDLAGAVVRPAVYELKRGQSLADLIQAAGGFRPDAALQRVSVYRLLAAAERGPGAPPRAVIDVALAPLPLGKRGTGNVPPGDPPLPVTMPTLALEDGDSVVVDAVKPLAGQYYVSIVGVVNNVGRINVNLAGALRDTTSSSNIILQPGDSIEVPEYQPAVKVSGAVNSPGSVLWKKGENLEYYLEGAGGVSYRAEKSKVSVRYALGEVRTRRRSIFGASDPKSGPGSEVFVPVRDSTERTNYVALVGAVAQILASTVAIIVVLRR